MNWLVWWLACCLWSGTFLFIKIGVSQVPPLTFAWMRLAIALLVLIPLALKRRDLARLSPAMVLRILIAGIVLLGVNYGLLYWGARRIPSGLVAILQSATPIFALLLACLAGLERATMRKLIALGFACAGVAIIFRSDLRMQGADGVTGALAVLSSSFCVAAAYVWLKRQRIDVHPLTITMIQCLSGLAVLAPSALIVEGNPLSAQWTASSVGAVLYLAIGGSVFAFWLNYWLLDRIDASAMLMMGIAEVPIALALGAAVLNERVPSGALIGALSIVIGVSMLSLNAQRPRPAAS